MAVRFVPNLAGIAMLTAQLKEVKAVTAEVYAEQLRDNLSAGPRSGRKYPDLPRQSSGPGEFSQEQSGNLKSMVYADEDSFGFAPRNAEDREQVFDQEFGDGDRLAGRANLRRTATEPKAKAQALQEVRKV